MTPPDSGDAPIPEHLFTAVDHVGIAVEDLDAAMVFYREVYGMRVLHEETNTDQGVREAMLGFADSATRIQLLAPLNETSPIARFLERSGPGVQQLAFEVADIEHATAGLREHGMRVLYDEARRGTSGSLVNFIHPRDAGGVLIELVEPPSGHARGGRQTDRPEP